MVPAYSRIPGLIAPVGCRHLPAFLAIAKKSTHWRTSISRVVNAKAASDNQVYILPITGDGRCMFRALTQGNHLARLHESSSDLVLLSFEAETLQADTLRQSTCDELLCRKDDIAPFIDLLDGQTFEDYVNRMRLVSTWGGEPELAAAVHIIKRPIVVFLKTRQTFGKISEYGSNEYNGFSVPLLFHGAGHYELLVQGDIQAPPTSKL